MCMLCVVPPNVVPSRDKLVGSAINNPDGFGFGIVIPSEKRLLVERTMNPDEAVNRFLELRGKYLDGYALWHARLATHGDVGIDNCHPFYVCDDKTILAHNGIISVDIPTGDKRSDTRVFAEDILASIGGVTALDNSQVFNMLEDFISGSKVAVLTADENAKFECYILNADKGTKDDTGVWWSNTTYTLSSMSKPYSYGGWDSDLYLGGHSSYLYEKDDYEHGAFLSRQNLSDLVEKSDSYGVSCVKCKAWIDEVEEEEWTCPFCKTCQMCVSHIISCLCYVDGDGKRQAWLNETKDVTEILIKRFDKGEMPSRKWLAKLSDTPTRWEMKDDVLSVYETGVSW